MEQRWIDFAMGIPEGLGEKPVTLSTTDLTWTDLGANPGLRVKKPTTNRLSYGPVFDVCLL
jgi:hypothetical protein